MLKWTGVHDKGGIILSKNKKIVNYKKPFSLNIGVVIFVIIFIYILFNIFSYFTKTRISVYEVEQGTIAENNTYNGLALRSENVVYADTAGYVNYYLKDVRKASYNTLVYSIDESGDIANQIKEASLGQSELSKSNLNEIGEVVGEFDKAYDASSFYNVYSFKENVDAQIMEALNLNALDTIGDYTAYAQANNTFHLGYAQIPGIVAYYTDGYENVTVDTFEPDMLNELDYNKNNLKMKEKVAAGDPLYKLVTDETWNIIVPVTRDVYERLTDESAVQIEFTEDGRTLWVNFEERQISDGYYLFLKLNNSMVRYVQERFIEIELLLNKESGLKIPNTAITEKEFFKVPKEYFAKAQDSSGKGVMIKDPATGSINFIATSLYYETEDSYYIDEDEVHAGTVLQRPDSNETYTVGETAKLQGVYNINKGYAVFKQISILYQNEEYSIVETGTSYGLSLYDHIALDGSKVNENDLIN